MLGRLFHRAPKIGDRATVRVGPYAGRSGYVTAVAGIPPRYEVTIDDCCRADVLADDLTVVRHSFFAAMDAAAERREHSAIGGYSRSQEAATIEMISELFDEADEPESIGACGTRGRRADEEPADHVR